MREVRICISSRFPGAAATGLALAWELGMEGIERPSSLSLYVSLCFSSPLSMSLSVGLPVSVSLSVSLSPSGFNQI